MKSNKSKPLPVLRPSPLAQQPLIPKQPLAAQPKDDFGRSQDDRGADLAKFSPTPRPPGQSALSARALALTPKERAATAALNKKASAQAPALGPVLANPAGFVKDIKARFAAQKALTPAAPYTFDFSDHGLPVLKDMAEHLKAEVLKVQGQLQALQDSDIPWLPDFLTGHGDDVQEAELGLKHLGRLQGEVSRHLKAGKINYRQLQELGYFAARAFGHFDLDDLNLRDRTMLAIDRRLQGYEAVSIEEEIERYCAREFTVFQQPSPVGGFQKAEATFEEAFFNKEEMKLVSVPTMEHLGPGPFMRLLPYDVYLMGISPEPAAADGFVRPGGDFWLHDMRHASAIFDKHEDYANQHNLSEPQKVKLAGLVDKWKVELNEARKEIPDKSLRYAIGFMSFNFHHDRGYRMVPSSFVDEVANDHVPRLLYEMLRAADQPRGFEDPAQTLEQAFDWLQNFWLARVPQEQALLNAKPQ